VFVQSFKQFYSGFWRGPDSNLYLHIYEKAISIDTNSIVVTNNHRHTYFLLDTRGYRAIDHNYDGEIDIPKNLTWDLIEQKGSLFVLGDSTYINSAYSQVQEMANSNDYKFELSPLTPDLEKFEGWALVKLSFNKSQ
jgi:hypothetical protein